MQVRQVLRGLNLSVFIEGETWSRHPEIVAHFPIGLKPPMCISRYTRRMSAVPADLTVSSRWILPMTSPDDVFENHTVVIRDRRILHLLPTNRAALHYAATAHGDRSQHL